MTSDKTVTHAQPAVFLDRDGTIIEEVGYIHRPEQVKLLPGAVEGLQHFQQCGYLLIVVSNQSGVARGYFDENTVHLINATLDKKLQAHNVHIHRYYYCPHHPEGTIPRYRRPCRCRKPEPGMVEQALRDFAIDLSRSIVIGDKYSDIQLGKRLGLTTILVLTGYGKETRQQLHPSRDMPDAICSTLREAAVMVCDKTL